MRIFQGGKNRIFLLLIIFLFFGIIAFGIFKSNFFVARAFGDKLNVYASKFEIVDTDNLLEWKNVGNAFYHDLDELSEQHEFNRGNSAYLGKSISLKLDDEIDLGLASSSDQASSSIEIKDALNASTTGEFSASSTMPSPDSSKSSSTSPNKESKPDDYSSTSTNIKENSQDQEPTSATSTVQKSKTDRGDSTSETYRLIKGKVLGESEQAEEPEYSDEEKSDPGSIGSQGSEDTDKQNELPNENQNFADPVQDEVELAPETGGETAPAQKETASQEPETPDPGQPAETEEGEVSFFNFLKNSFSRILDFNSAVAENKTWDFDLDSLYSKKYSNLSRETIAFSDFSIPSGFSNNEFGYAYLRSSMAGSSTLPGAKLVIEYVLNGESDVLDEYDLSEPVSNELEGGYFNNQISKINNWEDFNDISIVVSIFYDKAKIQQNKILEKKINFFLDSIWLEVDYNEKTADKEKINEKAPEHFDKEFKIEQLSSDDEFDYSQEPNFKFKYARQSGFFGKISSALFGFLKDPYKDISFNIDLRSPNGELANDLIEKINYLKNGEFDISLLNPQKEMVPGRYSFEVRVNDGDKKYFDIKTFQWGTVAVNSNKSIYREAEDAYLQIGVLNDKGHTVCDADISLDITRPDGFKESFSNLDGSIVNNPLCGPDNVIDSPDYYLRYKTASSGIYNLSLRAVIADGVRNITDSFEVRGPATSILNIPFDIERVGPTRIYPKAPYKMSFSVIPNLSASGTISEFVPNDFEIFQYSGGSVSDDGNYKKISWTKNWEAGKVYELSYKFDAPDLSPEMFFLGPANVLYSEILISSTTGAKYGREKLFSETRRWKILSDAPSTRANTVQFIAGNYTSSDGITGSSSDTNLYLPAFNFELAETNVNIQNAFIKFESQYEAYANNAGNWTGYELRFDACSEPCTADPYGVGAVLKNDNTVLSYSESESNQVRLLLDVSGQSALSTYSGGGTQLEGRVGYRIERGGALSAIANSRAVLYLTYTYNSDSESITKTVSYPLDSTSAGNSGTRLASQANCTVGSNCPIFDYNMDITEFSQNLSQWFAVYEQNDGNGANDIYFDVNIEGTDVNSSRYVHESANGGTQGNFPAVFFSNVSGYAENIDQQLEMHPYNSGTHYLLGGEVFETYVASSSASVKTRTVRFPMGALSNGLTAAISSKSVNVYFPENGTASGTVSIKSAYFRIISHDYNSGNNDYYVYSKIGDAATSSIYDYKYNPGGTVIKPSFNIVHVIASSSYAELEKANASTSKSVLLAIQNSDATTGGSSAELVVTYTYSSETNGYLSSLTLFGGQSDVNGNAQSTTTATADAVIPETADVTMLSGGLLASYLFSDSDANVNGSNMLLDANLSTGVPTCSNAFNARMDSVNGFTEVYQDIVSVLNTTDGQRYNACYSNDGAGDVSGGAKMNGILVYTYQYYNPPSIFVTADSQYKSDNATAISNNTWTNESEVKLYSTAIGSSTQIDFYFQLATSSADFSTATTAPTGACSSGTTYSLCSSKIWTITSNTIGQNASGTVSITGIPDSLNQSSGYVWQVFVCDDLGVCSYWDDYNALEPNFKVDATVPTAPGSLSLSSKLSRELVLNLGASTTETNFVEYRIYYATSSPVATSSFESDDPNFDFQDYNSAATTSIGGLQPDTQYFFNIFAYDIAGNISSSTQQYARTAKAERANTVKFLAGVYSGDGTTGQNSDTNQTFSSFNFQLVENGVNVENAYVVFEAQFEAYANNAGSYTGYTLAFDTCAEPCSVTDAYNGLVKTDSTVLAYDETDSNQTRLLFDVTNQLSTYSGGQMEGQIGYNLQRGAAINSIASTKAMLVITYTYDADSKSRTNTVAYPLESGQSGDFGTKTLVQTDDCTLDSTCPLFGYNMYIPEYAVSQKASQLSTWFSFHNLNDSNAANDIHVDVNIEGTDVNSTEFVHEAATANEISNTTAMYFSNVSGYAENTDQNLEYHAINSASGGNYYLVGGEVFETYTASSSARTKTRTVSFPFGVINNGLTSASSSAEVDVYFPENGMGSGFINIEKAWFRIISNNYLDGANTMGVSATVGTNATSSYSNYNYNTGRNVAKPSFNITHLLDSSNYSVLEQANVASSVPVRITTKNSNSTSQGGTAAELVITYTYTDESEGYLTSLSLMAGQSSSAGNASLATSSFISVFPESDTKKTLYGASLLSSYSVSDSDSGVPGGANEHLFDANIAIGSPTCTNVFSSRADGINAFTEYYKDVANVLGTNYNTSYTACFSNANAGDTSAGAKMNGQLIYTYSYYDAKVIKISSSSQYRSDGTTQIPNGGWGSDTVYLEAEATFSATSSTMMDFYYELLDNNEVLSTATTVPASTCSSGTSFTACSSKIWKVSSSSLPTDWYNGDWLYREKLTINASQVIANAVNFPVLATTTNLNFAHTSWGGKMSSSTGADIVITDSDGITTLNYEREHYSSSTGEIVLWIKTDISSTTDKDLYIYYGNASITNDLATSTGVWDSNYTMVYHLGEPAGTTGVGSVKDSVGTSVCTPSGGISFGNAGRVGYTADFSSGTGINCGSLGNPPLQAETTISYWAYSNNIASPSRQNPFNQAYGGWGTMTLETSGNMSWFIGSNGGDGSPYTNYAATTLLSSGSWYYVTLIRDPNGYNYRWYRNGNYFSGGTYNSAYPVINTRTFTLGDGYVNPWNGYLDEFRVSKKARSSSWIKTEFNNQSDVNSFITFSGQEQPLTTQAEVRTSITGVPNSSNGYKWQVKACNTYSNCSDWKPFNAPPNFYIDSTPPIAPGSLTLNEKTSTSITLDFGNQASDSNFVEYRIYYKEGVSGVTTDDIRYIDSDLSFLDYNGTSNTKITGLFPGTDYVFNIWAYDIAGNKTGATEVNIATNDAPRAKTVMFYAGSYSGDGTTGQNSDTNQTFSSFDFSLAEADVNISNAYILFEAQFEAYANNAGDYTGYDLAIDTCQKPCTASAFSGLVKTDSTVLAYDETESNMVRILFDVTSEAQLATYNGAGVDLDMQVGYNLNRGAAVNSIANAKAMLYVTYTYDDTSETITNTVVYPLESISSGDSGSRQSVQTDDCILNSNCPLFNYNIDIPEFSASPGAKSLSKWFKTSIINDGNGSEDVSIDVNIEGTDATSAPYVHESVNGNTQGNAFDQYFSGVAGFSENSSQTLELRAHNITTGGNYYLLGGEAYETYTASSASSIKTRTVSFPIGAINNGLTSAITSGSVNVQFPENGNSTGNVSIKKAWLRIKSNNYNTGANTITVSTKIGDNATSSDYVYNYDVGGINPRPTFDFIHVIPQSDYAEMELANGSVSKAVQVNTTNSNSANQGGTSAELMITYAYTDESYGYLSNFNIIAGQADVNGNSTLATTSISSIIFPEKSNKTILAAALIPSYLISDSDSNVPSSANVIYGANLATSSASCSNTFISGNDNFNTFTEFYTDVSGQLSTTHNQSYEVCYSINHPGDASAGAKMNGQLVYTYQYYNPPQIPINAAEQYKADNFTTITNGAWTDENEVNFYSTAKDSSTSTLINFYVELLPHSGSFTPTTTVPSASCSSGTAYGSCASKFWTTSYSTASSTSWYDTNWLYRKKITINANQVATTTPDFPVLATTTDSNLAYTAYSGHVASSTGADILVTDTNGTTTLAFEREYYDPATGELVLWVKTDISSTTNKEIYVYYGNTNISQDYSTTTGVWSNNYDMVLHMDDDTSSQVLDSTSNNFTGTKVAVDQPLETTGHIGKAQYFDGSDSINLGDILDPGSSDFTVEVWFKPTIVGSINGSILYNKENLYEASAGGGYHTYAWQPHWAWDGGTSFPTTVDNWYYGVVTYNHSRQEMYSDGSWVYGRNQTGNIGSNANVLYLGRRTSGGAYFTGDIDEVRISKTARHAGWIKTQYNNQSDIASFLSYGSEESRNDLLYEGTINVVSIPDSASGYKWQVIACNEESVCSEWDAFSLSPNFLVDNTPPTSPGNLALATTTATTIKLNLGAVSTETNFAQYKIFYKSGLSGVTESDLEHSDANLNYIDYNGAASTTITGLEANTQYVINIWAYDKAGNKASAVEINVTTASAAHARGQTVRFIAGSYTGDGTTGQNTDTDYTFSTFNFELAETSVNIKNAFIVFEAQIEGYADNTGDYIGYDLMFDACSEPCTADATGVSGLTVSDNSVLAYGETESNQIKLLADVTNETQMALYAGDDSQMEAQVGYNIGHSGDTLNSIASAKVILYITYTFDGDNSTNFTNTIAYPLESTNSGDSGSRQTSISSACTLDSNCSLYAYNVQVPEIDTKLDQWFEMNAVNDGNGTNDLSVDVNIEGYDVNSNTIVHESALGGTQGNFPGMLFKNVTGFSENTAQSLEYHTTTGGTMYMIGGEVYETYTASVSANTKTRTVSFPLGIISNGNSTALASGTVDVYFPENGGSGGVVNIEKAWLRIMGEDYASGAYTLTVSTKVGDNSQSGNYIYNIDTGGTVIKPNFKLIHVIPSFEYTELEAADIDTPKTIILNTTNSSVNMGGVSAELMITYTYTDESNGYLSTIELYGGQTVSNANSQSDTISSANAIFPELRGSETIRAAMLDATYMISDSDGSVPATFFALDAGISTTTPICSPVYKVRPDITNGFHRLFKDVSSSLTSTDNQSYSVCLANSNSSDVSAGAKMNAVWTYTYQWDAPPSEFTQDDWRWYENIDSTEPTSAKAVENTAINGINVGEILRLRMNIGISKENLAVNTQNFKLQYGVGSDCTSISSWNDVGAVGGAEQWIGYNNPAPVDGQSLSSTLLSSSTHAQSYEEDNSSANNPAAVNTGEYGEWDWVIYDNSATSSSNYCFRMVEGDGTALTDYLTDSYPKLTTAPVNTAPADASGLGQFKIDETTVISNGGWTDESEIRLVAGATDPNINETITLYFELITATGTLTTATSEPTGACVYGTSYTACASKIWFSAAGSSGDYRASSYIGTTSITSLSENFSGYKWQVLACDSYGECSNWSSPGFSPNIKIDLTAPTPPGSLSFAKVGATGLRLAFGASSTESNFDTYKIFYKVGTAGVSEADVEHNDAPLGYIDYNGATSTFLNSLSANTDYVFNIWAYDLVGHTASSVAEIATTTLSSFTPPTGLFFTTSQKTDGSGAVDINLRVDDPDNDDTLRAFVEYEAGVTCAFSSAGTSTIDQTDANVTATYGDPDIDNNANYQVGTSTAWIVTSPGENFVQFDWLSKQDTPTANGTYCLRLIVNDGLFDQTSPDTQLIILDNVNPSTPGALTLASKNNSSVRLAFGSQSSDTNFDQYKIFYKIGSTSPSESDTEHSDSNLSSSNYSGATSTLISGLSPNTTYVFNIWAYDTKGNKASSTEITVKTNAVPTNIAALNQVTATGSLQIINGDWISQNGVRLSAGVHDQDSNDLVTFYYQLVNIASSTSAQTSPPSSACSSSTAYGLCASKIWSISTTTSSLQSDWFNKEWLYRKKLTINSSKVNDNLVNFPLLATTSDADLMKARSDGYDLVFTKSDGITELNFEREYFDSSTGELNAWVKTDLSSTTDTYIYLYYGNSAESTDHATTTGVWDNNFKGVWHLNETVIDEDTAVNIHTDSSGSGNNGDQNGNNETSGEISNGQEMDGNDFVQIADSGSLDMADEITLSAWLKLNQEVNWKYKRNITFSTSTPVNNYQVMVQIGTDMGFDYSKTMTNGEDIRFYNTSNVLLDYWIEEWNSSGTSTLWVNVPSSGTTNIILKYGNAGASAYSNGTSTFDFFDEFSGLDSKWQINADNYSVSSGVLRINLGAVTLANPLSFNLEDGYVLESRMYHYSNSGGYGGTLSGQSSQYTQGGNGGADATSLYMRTSGSTGINRWTGSGASTGYTCGNGAVWSSSNLVWYVYGSRFDSSGVTLTLDRNSGTNYGCGWSKNIDYISLGAFDGTASYNVQDTGYDWVLIRKLATTEPSASVGGENVAGISKSNAYSIAIDSSTIYSTINSTTATTTAKSGWNLVTISYDRLAPSNQLNLYVNNQPAVSKTLSSTINTNNFNLIFGDLLKGVVDEVNISNIARSAEWIETKHNNLLSVDDFISFSSEDKVTSYFESVLAMSIPDSASGYKWQVMACDDDSDCSAWDQFGTSTPNFKIDTLSPTAPGALTLNARSSNSISLNFGAQTVESNFSRYRIFYSTSSPVSEGDFQHTDSNLDSINYGGQTMTTVSGLNANTQYYFNIWAYDLVGQKASSTIVNIATTPSVSSPGVIFYTRNSRTLYYKVWDGSDWSVEQTGPTIGSGAGDNIKHIRSIRSDDGGKVAVLIKTWDTINQEWWGTVYRFVANDFVNTTQFGSAEADANNTTIITGCLASLSGGEFVAVRNNNAVNGTLVYSWDAAGGWTAEGAGPNPAAVMSGCKMIRRPSTDNYLLITHDDTNDVGVSYYYGGSTYSNLWTAWTQYSAAEENADNFSSDAYFDPSDNTKGVFIYKNGGGNDYVYARYFMAGDSTINYGAEYASPSVITDDWNSDFVWGEFAVNPGSSGEAYYIGSDITDQTNIYQIDISSLPVNWATTTNGRNISGGALYDYANRSHKPFDMEFYRADKAIALWNDRTAGTPNYRLIDSTFKTVDAADSSVPGAPSDIWTRVRLYNDPAEDELLAVYQNDNIDISAVFFEGGNDRFYNSSDHPGSKQVWTNIAASTGAQDKDDEVFSFSYTAFNSPPNSPVNLAQMKSDASTTIANLGWTNESDVYFSAEIIDPDTSEGIKVYLELVTEATTFATSTTEPSSACLEATAFAGCAGKIWLIASSTGDYSIFPLVATATIASIPDSASGYKWQIIACDDEVECSAWSAFNATTPNFYVDTQAPNPGPGNLTVNNKTSTSITLGFGSAATESNFLDYKIFYKVGSSNVTESDTEHDDSDLDYINYNGTTETTISGLATSTQYVFNIWAYDKAGNTASASVEVFDTTNAPADLLQALYLLENDDGADVNSNSADVANDTALVSVKIGERINARLQMENNGGDSASSKVYKLQYENQTDSPGTWIDVGATSEISYSLGLSGSNGDIITTTVDPLNPKAWINGTWHEGTNSTGSFTIDAGDYTEFVFAIETSNALTSKTYRLRLYNSTDSKTLNSYTSYPTLTTVVNDTIRYSKDATGALSSGIVDQTYYLDSEGYSDVNADDNSNRDEIISNNNYPVIMFATKNSNNSDAIDVIWNGQSSTAATSSSVVLQVYKYGSPSAWVTVATNNTAGADADFNLISNLNSELSTYYDGSYWTYWRVYQAQGTHTLRSDYYNISFSSPVPETAQIHHRWRNDDGSQTTATWREAEDLGDPSGATSPLNKLENIRLRFDIANTGGGSALNYIYKIEYATSSGSCTSGIGAWTDVTIDGVNHWRMGSSTNFADADASTAQLANSESYSFVTGKMIEEPSATSSAVTLTEDEYSEFEYIVQATLNADTAGTYCFRLTNNGTALDTYSEYPILTLAGNTNNAPNFMITPSDGGSASTSPTNEGSDITFTATAQDDDIGDDYYLAICKTNSISAGNDGPPVCTSGDWCTSDLASSTSEASCSYTTSDSSELLPWYGFACDKHAGFSIAKCSAMSQGTSTPANNSPFAINHPPVFTSVNTSVDNQDPGSTFTISSASSDTDSEGGTDTINYYVCLTNSASFAGCAGGPPDTVCSVTGTTTTNVACDYSDTAPSPAGATTYYAFVYDGHGLAATTNSLSNTYTINNSPPTLGSLTLNSGSDIVLNLKGAGDTSISTINTSVTDLNGCDTGIVSATAVVYMSNASSGYNCTADNNDCYRIPVSGCVKSDCTGDTDSVATYTCTADLKYYAVPTDNSSGNLWEAYNWLSYLNVYDGSNYSATTSAGVELNTTIALDVTENIIDFGSNLFAGQDTGDTNSTTTVTNAGNSPIDTNISGTNMNGVPVGSIGVSNIEWSLTPSFTWSTGIDLSTIDTKVNTQTSNPNSDIGTEDEIYWGVGVPFSSEPGVYNGQNTFSVTIDQSDWSSY